MTRWKGVLAAGLMTASLASAEYSGTTGGQTLQRLVPARPTALGEAFTAIGGDIDAITVNPAGVAKIPGKAISTTYQKAFADQSFGSLMYAHPISFGSLFVGGGYFDAGTIDINQTDGTNERRRAQQDVVGMAGFALGRHTPFSLGVTGKFLRSELAEEATAEVAAFDAGLQWETPVNNLVLGAAAQNMGPDIEYEQEGDPLPSAFRGGISYDLDPAELGWVKDFPYQFLLTVDGIKTKDEDGGVLAGLEVTRLLEFLEKEGSAAIRGGYRSDRETVTAGIGFMVGNIAFDYAVAIIADLDELHRFTLSYRFLPEAQEQKVRKKPIF